LVTPSLRLGKILGKRANQAGEIITKFVVSGCQDERGIHLESALSAMASLVGYAAQTAAIRLIQEKRPEAEQFQQVREVKSKSGEVFLLSELANQLVTSTGGPDRLTVSTLIANMGMRVGGKRVPDMVDIMQRNAASIGGQNYPPLSVPSRNFPRENALVALKRWWPVVVKVFSVEELRDIHPLYWMFCLSNETGKLIEQGKDVLDADIAMVLVMETAVAMSKVTGIGTEFPKSA
jgi:hypothetical protein